MAQDCFRPLDDRPVLWDSAGWHRGGEIEAAAAALAPWLEGRPLVFLLCRNDAATVTAYLAAVRAGCAVALLDPQRPAAERDALAERYAPELIIASGPLEPPPGYGEETLGRLRLFRAPRRAPPPHPALCLLLATSGSTGSPKFVRLSHRAVTANAAAIARVLGLTPDERPLGHLALHYSYGLSVLNSHLQAGAAMVLCELPLTMREAWEVCRAQACTSLAGVPAHYELMRRLDFAALDLPALRTLTQAGGKLPPQTALLFHRRMRGRLFVMYGQTEAGPRMATLPPDLLPEKPASVGRALPGGRFEIRRDGGTAAPGDSGEIIYHGPNVMMGYARERADLERGDDLGGVLATGDIGHLDADGDLFVTGRLARFAKLFGLRLSLDDVESRLAPQLGRLAAVERDGRVVVHCCAEVAPAAFRDALRRLGLPAAGFALRQVEDLPLTASGKVDYRRLGDD